MQFNNDDNNNCGDDVIHEEYSQNQNIHDRRQPYMQDDYTYQANICPFVAPININDEIFSQSLEIPINDFMYTRELSPGFISVYRIYDILIKARVPFYLHNKLIETIGMEINMNGFDPFDPEFKQQAFVREMCRKFKSTSPQIIPIHLERYLNDNIASNPRELRDTFEVICFDFEDQFRDIMSDYSLFGNLDNLVINRDMDKSSDQHWLPYKNSTGTMYEVLDGLWYQQYVIPLITNTTKEFAVPIGLYIDASETVTYQSYSFQPLIMFPLILNVNACNKKTSSRVVALIPDLEAKSSAVKDWSKSTTAKQGMAIRNYHKCMEAALSSLKRSKQAGGVHCYVRIGAEIRFRLCKIPVAFILGDAKSQDCIRGRYAGHICSRMCRACDVHFNKCALPDVECNTY